MNFKRDSRPWGVMIFPDKSLLDQFKVIPSVLTPDRKQKWITAPRIWMHICPEACGDQRAPGHQGPA